MRQAAQTEGLRLLVDGERAEAADWRRFRSTPTPEARTALFDRYRWLARQAARSEHRRLDGMGLERSDCEQLAYEALLQSIERFDPDRGTPFSAYARPRMFGAIRNALTKANEARAAYTARKRAENERFASLKKQARERGAAEPIDTLRELVVGIALGFMLEDNADAEARQVACEAPSAYDGLLWKQLIQAMEDKIASLPETERLVIEYHYRQDLLFAEIATLLGLSRGRISQIHSKALGRLRKSLEKIR